MAKDDVPIGFRMETNFGLPDIIFGAAIYAAAEASPISRNIKRKYLGVAKAYIMYDTLCQVLEICPDER